MEAQQFHLKWNNHSLNTLSSFQQLLDTNTLVDVSLTCSNGKTVTAHRMVLAACSDYFYHLFKDLPERHPVIVFKDAGEEIVRDLLLFMYKGEVEVQEVYLNDFLKFADTLQVKGLSQSDRDGSPSSHNITLPSSRHNPSNAAQDLSPTATSNTSQPSIAKDAPSKTIKTTSNNGGRRSATSTPKLSCTSESGEQAIPLIKGNNNNNTTSSGSSPSLLPSSLPGTPVPNPLGAQDLAKSYLANLSKFPSLFPLAVPPTSSDPTTPPPSGHLANPLGLPPGAAFSHDLMSSLSSPNLYRALQRKYPENPVLLKQMPFFKKMFGDNPDIASAALAAMYPQLPPMPTNRDDNDNDSIAERSPPTTPVPASAMNLPGLPGIHIPSQLPGVHLPTTIQSLMRPGLPLTPIVPAGLDGENGFPDRGNNSSPMDSDSPYPPSSGAGSIAADLNSTNGSISSPTKTSGNVTASKLGENESDDNKKEDRNESGDVKHVRGSKGGSAGRGSRLERMIAAEYKIMSEYSEGAPNPEALPVMTPELMKSRRTHSLQLAIAEIMHNRASVQSAATKYHIPRETLRRHYQRYLKTMGIERAPGTNGPVKGASGTTATAVAAATNNNASKGPGLSGAEQQAVTSMAQGSNPLIPTSIMQSLASGIGGNPALSIPGEARGTNEANCFSSLMEIGQAYGIWSPDVVNKDNHNSKDKHADDNENIDEDSKDANDKDKDDGLVIDEREDDEEDVEVDDDEPLSPGGPEDEQPMPSKPSTRKSSQVEPMDSSPSSSSSVTKSSNTASVGTAASNSISKAPMETSA